MVTLWGWPKDSSVPPQQARRLLLRRICCLRGLGSCLLALLPSCPLLQQLVSAVGQKSELSVLHAHEPVAKAATNARIDGVDPERFLVEEGSHFDTELP